MPCTKCEEGNYKWGETGECKYDTLQDCESANSKYNKMQPTPLGKKTYEEYEKELKEFNLSKVERVELGILQDGEKATQIVKDLIKEGTDRIGFLYDVQSRAEKKAKVINGMRADIIKELKSFDNSAKALQEEKKDLFMTSSTLRGAVDNLNKIVNELTVVAKDLGVDVPGLTGFKKTASQGGQMDKNIEKAYNKAELPERPSQSF